MFLLYYYLLYKGENAHKSGPPVSFKPVCTEEDEEEEPQVSRNHNNSHGQDAVHDDGGQDVRWRLSSYYY